MPTILRILGYRFFFYSNEGNEPAHIHVEKGDDAAKFWLEPVELANSYGFNASELNELRKLVVKNQKLFIDKWNEYFTSK